jgi:NAD(P)-dependent dehydrogenase (short-subunit alcohol dehydrogenase family)
MLSSWWKSFEESDFARSIPFGNRYREPGFSLDGIPSLKGRVVLITGASAGLGRQSAAAVAVAGAITVLGCRDETRGRAAVEWVQAAAPSASVSLLQIDLSSRESVKSAAAEFMRRFSALHVLINNGGIPAGTANPLHLADGVEECFQVNHLGHFQLTLALLPLLKASAPSRIVHVSSSAHRYALLHPRWLSLDVINDGSAHSMVERYGMAKLAQLSFSTELHRRLQASGDTQVLSNAIHPGIVATELVTSNAQRNFGWALGGVIQAVMGLRNRLMAYDVVDGALTQLFAATSPSVQTGGGYYVPIAQPWRTAHPLADDETFARQLWDFSEVTLARAPDPPTAAAAGEVAKAEL